MLKTHYGAAYKKTTSSSLVKSHALGHSDMYNTRCIIHIMGLQRY